MPHIKTISRGNLMELPSSSSSEYEELLLPVLPPDYRTGFARQHLNVVEGAGGLPFSRVHDPSLAFGDVRREVYIPREVIVASITRVERDYGGNLLSPYLYTIELAHGHFTWRIKRRYSHFLSLHRHLQMYRASLKIPKAHIERRSFRDVSKQVQTIPHFPMKPEALVAGDGTSRRARQLEKFLNAVIRNELLRNHEDTLSFLEICHLSFVVPLGSKLKEGLIKKNSVEERSAGGWWRAFCFPVRSICSIWHHRWFMLRDTFLIVIRPTDGTVSEVMLMDNKFEVQVGLYKTGRHRGISLSNQTRRLAVSSSSREETDEWLQQIRHVMTTTAREFIVPSRFGGFAPVRVQDQAQWLIDGESYMKAVAQALEKAKEEIFITDWMLSAEIFLIRPILDDERWRLDKVLKRKADQGVKIFILLYKEVEIAINLGSSYTKNKLEQLHSENIMLMRHPDHLSSGVFLWAHHEKMVVIDQTYAFLGGIDLSFGRWDNHHHRLVDLDEESESQSVNGDVKPPTVTVTKLANALENADTSPKLSVVEDTRKSRKSMKEQSTRKSRKSSASADNAKIPQVSESPSSPTMYNKKRVWLGKDYANFIFKDLVDLHLPFVDSIDRTSVVRMPWHDVGVVVQGKSARDVARHFIQRWNATKYEKARNNSRYPILLPKRYENLDDIPPVLPGMKTVSCQILRSAGGWSAGIKDLENSIHDAYVQVITEAKHFVYIENQFFITLTGTNYFVHNKIADAIYKRITLAHSKMEIFRVYVVMPLLPAFQGELGTETGHAIQAIAHWNYSSMSQGPNSLYVRLAQKVGDPTNYLTFYGLRTHDILMGKPVTELVYVHSKLMIADDQVVIIGSANINDRSMLGERDSEMAVMVEDVDFFTSRMAGQPFNVGTFAGSLRRRLFREHLGLIDVFKQDMDVSDPVSERFFKTVWLGTAARNSKIFDEVFSCLPSDLTQTFAQMKQFMKTVPLAESNVEEAHDRLRGVTGQLVLMPLLFLSKEALTPPPGSVEGIMPTSLWT